VLMWVRNFAVEVAVCTFRMDEGQGFRLCATGFGHLATSSEQTAPTEPSRGEVSSTGRTTALLPRYWVEQR
jgi:hypothetical protein